MSSSGADRHQPLPSVWRLPGYGWRRLGPGGRVVEVLAGLALIATAVAFAPRISENKRSDREREAAQQARFRRDRIAELRSQQRPRTRAVGAGGLAGSLERAIEVDAESRPGPDPLRVECRRRAAVFACDAVTSDVRSPGGARGIVALPYRARAAADGRSFTFCRISGLPGEGNAVGQPSVPLSARCGG